MHFSRANICRISIPFKHVHLFYCSVRERAKEVSIALAAIYLVGVGVRVCVCVLFVLFDGITCVIPKHTVFRFRFLCPFVSGC